MQQTVYWKHLALFLFVNGVQTYFDFLHICSLFEIAQGCFNGDVLEWGQPARCSKAGSSHSTSLLQPRHAPRDGNLARIQAPTPAPRPPLPQALLQADFAPDAAALAESNLKGFANTSMVLIETNIHQSASRSDSTSSGKDHSSPADLGTVSWQQPWSSMATGSLLPVLPVPQGKRGHPTTKMFPVVGAPKPR